MHAYPDELPYSLNCVPIVSKQRILITGARGYLGLHLFRHLSSNPQSEVHGTYRSATQALHLHHQLDLSDAEATIALIGQLNPQQIYHAAGNIGGRDKTANPFTIWNDNLLATLNLYEASLKLPHKPRVLFVSSGSIYGEHPGPISESTPLNPASIYAASKAAADLASYTYWRSHGLPVIRARLFNYVGPQLPETTALGSFAYRIARLEQQPLQPAILEVGNLDAERDYLAIQDVVSAFIQLMERGKSGEAYNVASGISHPMKWYLDKMLAKAKVPITVKHDTNRMRSTEAMKLQVDVRRLTETIGWKPEDSVEQALFSLNRHLNP